MVAFTKQYDHFDQSWTLDATGNMSSITTNGTSQTRTQNAANETLSASGWAKPAYDRVGNMATTPAPARWRSAARHRGYAWETWIRRNLRRGTFDLATTSNLKQHISA